MKAYKCDICKQFYDDTAFDSDAKTDPFTGDPIFFTRKGVGVLNADNGVARHDVCPSCMQALQTACMRIEKEGYEWIK